MEVQSILTASTEKGIPFFGNEVRRYLVNAWSELPYPEQALILTKDQEVAQDVVDAKNEELENMIRDDVLDAVPYSDQTMVSSCWIITEKFKGGRNYSEIILERTHETFH